jgi:uncharacterized membrane protein
MQGKGLGKRLQNARMLLAALGLLISIYLAVSSSLNIQVACPSTQLINCSRVLSSLYSTTFGVPNTYYGILFFVLVLVFSYIKQPELLALLNAGGLGFMLYFLYSEYRLGSICLYCTAVHVITFALFLISVYEISR